MVCLFDIGLRSGLGMVLYVALCFCCDGGGWRFQVLIGWLVELLLIWCQGPRRGLQIDSLRGRMWRLLGD